MVIRLLLLFLFTISTVVFASGENEVIYGRDDIVDANSPFHWSVKKLAKSVAARISMKKIVSQGDHFVPADFVQTIGAKQNLCVGEKFYSEPDLSDCSGFLVSDNILMTAGHCVRGNACDNFFWVFDYKSTLTNELTTFSFKEENVYSCLTVLKSSEDLYPGTTKKIDYAFIQLDRSVLNRAPLRVNLENNLKVGSSLFAIGHPWGSPQRFSLKGKVLDNSHELYFSSSLDVFQGNSGAPVFNQKTKMVEGIIVRGKSDYLYSIPGDYNSCAKINHCSADGLTCDKNSSSLGEEATKLSFIKKIFSNLVF